MLGLGGEQDGQSFQEAASALVSSHSVMEGIRHLMRVERRPRHRRDHEILRAPLHASQADIHRLSEREAY